MKLSHSLVLTLPLVSGWAVAADLSVKFDLPQLNVAEYHKPYVAIWLERADQSVAANLAVLYDLKKDAAGDKWVKDLRTWWRKAGRDAKFPLDGVSGATRPAGSQTMKFDGAKHGLDKLPAGDYKLVVEASREAGGRELVKVPFTWTGKGKVAANAAGKEELGAVALELQ
ncbi:MAG: DUF2271 domain-containing protein [Massilia sp.]|jgi:hypothetical protein|uniref:DUF2271 domain-containing protein n=1 Tax=Massilia sp. TaxID=1882437 RepID=UPI0019B4FC32|nr:DUF2271 domain-containing protein [Oxalobacteraceae sp. CFBP 8761]MBD8626359.1 DUF2271 domain-containing protein [Oxalobacteraceae sp. CFBP 8753]MBD8630846.1 DUF2271 domain-containing protein [Oxalobacteraceae sp. CFBP 8755]MBD8725853.1 DUF2271 domain-containing protein [Oxalobacteraceae sp. CFBP 13708]